MIKLRLIKMVSIPTLQKIKKEKRKKKRNDPSVSDHCIFTMPILCLLKYEVSG